MITAKTPASTIAGAVDIAVPGEWPLRHARRRIQIRGRDEHDSDDQVDRRAGKARSGNPQTSVITARRSL